MNSGSALYSNKIFYRLVALWALCEAMLGGIIHGFKIPVSGLVIGSCAVICISLIAFYIPVKGAIIKATVIVAVFKFMLSPQSPPLAYFAVFFQGISGEWLFRNRKFYRLSCLLLGVIALLESGLQRILVLTIVYGNSFWTAIDRFISEMTGQSGVINYSLAIAVGYLALHLVWGGIVGWWAGIVPQKIKLWQTELVKEQNDLLETKITPPVKTKRKKWFRKGIIMIWVLLILLYLQSQFRIGVPVLPASIPLQILIRSAIIILAWYFFLGPLVSFFLGVWLKKKKLHYGKETEEVLLLLPELKQVVAKSWRNTSGQKGLKRILVFSKMVLAGALNHYI